MVKRVESVPAVMVMVADSLTEIVAALVEVEVFSAKENEVELVKVGAVVSVTPLRICTDAAPSVRFADPAPFV